MDSPEKLPDFMYENDGLTWALARAQYSFPPINKAHEADAGKYKYKYADLADVLSAIRPALNREGIALVQATEITEAGVELVTSLLYADERLSSRWPLPIANAAPQQVGSVLTYLRRYALCALVGIAAEDDDDGRAASDVRQATTAPPQQTAPSNVPAVDVPDDWKTRPLASMSFPVLRAIAAELKHPFSGGSKSELIRQLEPLVRAASGAEPFDTDGPTPKQRAVEPDDEATGGEPDSIPFQPTVFVGAAGESGTARQARNSAAKAGTP